MAITIQCPNPACGKTGNVSLDYVVLPVRCPDCHTKFRVPAEPGRVTDIQCPNPACGKTGNVSLDYVGQPVRCPDCHTKFRVPAEPGRVTDYPIAEPFSPPRGAQRQAPVTEVMGQAGDGIIDQENSSQAMVQVGNNYWNEEPVERYEPEQSWLKPPGIIDQDNEEPFERLEHIGRFQIRLFLGAGAFGEVYLAHDPVLEREVALKVPKARTLNSPQRIERFLREAKSAARLQHPHIVPVFDSGHDGTHYYIASAHIEGRTLAQAIDEEKLSWQRSAQIVRQLAEALAYAHSMGIVHRDVKPANVLVDKKGQPHLLDFGLAHQQGSLEGAGQGPVGTAAYMAPEQAAGQKAQPASDQYSLGVILYEMLCGVRPFSGPTPLLLFNVKNQEPPRPRQIRSDLSLDLEAICLKAMAKRPEQRYPSCQELAEDLRRWLAGDPVMARPLKTAEKVVRWCRHEPALTISGAVAVLCLLAVALIATWSAVDKAALAEKERAANAQAQQARIDAEQAKQKEIEQRKEAEAAGAQADKQRREADKQRKEAVTAQKEAEKKRLEAMAAQKETETARNQLKDHLIQAQRDLYFRLTVLAERELRDGNPTRARLLLDQCPKEILRGWEWRHLDHVSQKHLQAAAGSAEINRLAFNNTGSLLALPGQGQGVTLWNWYENKKFNLPGHKDEICCVAFSKDGRYLASGSRDQTIIIWKNLPGTDFWSPVLTLYGSTDHVWGVAFSPDGKVLSSACKDKTVRVWDVTTGKLRHTLLGHAAPVRFVTFNPEGNLLCSADEDGHLIVWALQPEPTLFMSLRGYTCGAFSPDSSRLAVAREDGIVLVLDAKTKDPLLTLEGHKGEVYGVTFSRDGNRLAAGGGKSVKVWTTRGLLLKHYKNALCFAFSPDGLKVATLGEDKTVKVWSLASGKIYSFNPAGKVFGLPDRDQLNLEEYDQHTLGVAYSSDSKFFASASGVFDKDNLVKGEVKVWDTATGQDLNTLGKPIDRVDCLAFSPDGERLALASKDKKIYVWNWKKLNDDQKSKLKKMQGKTDDFRALGTHEDEVWYVVFSADGKQLYSAGKDKTVVCWDVVGGKVITKFLGHKGAVYSLALSPDGKLLASAGEDMTARIWDADTGKELFKLPGHTRAVASVAFGLDPEDKLILATSSFDRTVKIWDIAGRKLLRSLEGHTKAVLGVAFTPDSSRLASSGEDCTVRIWDPTTGQEALSLKSPTRNGYSLTFSPNGRWLAAGGADGIRIWEAPPFKLKQIR